MKIWQWILIIGFGLVFVVQSILAIIVIVFNLSWLFWFFIPLIFFFFVFVAILIGGLIVFFLRRKPEVLQIDLNSARQKAVYDMKCDTDNPDNFVIKKYKLFKIGREGQTPTPIIVFDGFGTERLERRVVIINLQNFEKESTLLINPKEEEIKECAIKMADYPPEYVQEETITSFDMFGKPTTIRKSSTPSYAEIKKAEEQKKADEKSQIT